LAFNLGVSAELAASGSLENVTLSTAADEYAWVNTHQVWGVGTVNFAAGKIHVEAYMQ